MILGRCALVVKLLSQPAHDAATPENGAPAR
jgi:hypothetical protein